VIEKHKVSLFYTAPTAIRAFMKSGARCPITLRHGAAAHPGERWPKPNQPRSPWIWYREVIGHGRCPIIRHLVAGTETAALIDQPPAGVPPPSRGSATLPLTGIAAHCGSTAKAAASAWI